MCYNISLGTLYIKVLYLRADNLRYDFSWVLLTHYVLLAPYGDIAINWTHVDFSLVRFGDILLRQEHITKALPFLLLDGWQPSTGVEGYWLHSKWLTTKLRGGLSEAVWVCVIWDSVGSGDGLMPEDTKPLPETMLNYHHCGLISQGPTS